MSKVVLGLALLVTLIVGAATASAQSAIAGVVKDTTGAVLPGVTVEASCPALIERTRSGRRPPHLAGHPAEQGELVLRLEREGARAPARRRRFRPAGRGLATASRRRWRSGSPAEPPCRAA